MVLAALDCAGLHPTTGGMDAPIGRERAIRAALAHQAYATDRVRLCATDLHGFECLVASRQGLFAAHRGGAQMVAHGFFFGLHRHGDTVFAFEACDVPSTASARGRILALTLADRQIAGARVIARGLDNACHQLAVIDDLICLVDTANQVIRRFALDGTPFDVCAPLAPVRRGEGGAGYHHINSIARVRGGVVLMLHNGADDAQRPSALAWLDPDWTVRRIEPLAGYGCHDIVEDSAGVLWHCGSRDGELLRSDGPPIRVSARMTRGLALGRDGLIVGTSVLGPRAQRTELSGSVIFLDREHRHISEITLAGAPTDIIAIGA